MYIADVCIAGTPPNGQEMSFVLLGPALKFSGLGTAKVLALGVLTSVESSKYDFAPKWKAKQLPAHTGDVGAQCLSSTGSTFS